MRKREQDDRDWSGASLPAEQLQARRFSTTRAAQSGALHEDYAELIADLLAETGEARPTDIARRLGVSHATAIKTIARLKRDGLARGLPYRGVFLTRKGLALAERAKARHRLVVDILLALGVPKEAAEADAEGMEHFVSEPTRRAFLAFLKSPSASALQRKSGDVEAVAPSHLCGATRSPSPLDQLVSSMARRGASERGAKG